jgi:CRP/FNR family transcriptional regulator
MSRARRERLVTFRPGTVLFRPSDECRGFLAVRKGRIKVSLTGLSGREIVLYRVQPGDICLQTFGCLAEARRYSAEGVAESEVVAELIPSSEFERRMTTDAAFRAEVFSAIARRFLEFEHVVEALAFAPLPPRVARGLLRLAGDGSEVAATHAAIAAEIGSAREAVSRQIAALTRAGLVKSGRGRLTLLDRPALERLAAVAQ